MSAGKSGSDWLARGASGRTMAKLWSRHIEASSSWSLPVDSALLPTTQGLPSGEHRTS